MNGAGVGDEVTVDWRVASGRAADALGVLLLAYLLWRVFFGTSEAFDGVGAAIGVTGLTSAWLGRRTVRTVLDVPIALYFALVVLSTALNAGRLPPLLNVTVWQPALQLGVLMAFFYGAVSLLRTPARLGVLTVALVVAISVIGVEAAYDYLTLSVAWRRIGHYPSVAQWSGYPQLGMLFAVALPLPLAALIYSRRQATIVASIVVAVALLLDLAAVNSRITYVAAGATYLALAAAEVVTLRQFRLLGIALATALCIVIYSKVDTARGGTFAYWWQTRLYLQYLPASGTAQGISTGFGRFVTWRHAAGLIRDRPWLGVGPAKYFSAVQRKYVDSWQGEDVHAHNTFLHVAAETGIPSALVLLMMWALLFKRLASAIARSPTGMLTIGFAGALIAFFVCSWSDHFTAYGLAPRNRIAFLSWTLLAAAVAAVRASRAEVRV